MDAHAGGVCVSRAESVTVGSEQTPAYDARVPTAAVTSGGHMGGRKQQGHSLLLPPKPNVSPRLGVSHAAFLLHVPGQNPSPCLFHILEASSVPGLEVPPSFCKSSHAAEFLSLPNTFRTQREGLSPSLCGWLLVTVNAIQIGIKKLTNKQKTRTDDSP